MCHHPLRRGARVPPSCWPCSPATSTAGAWSSGCSRARAARTATSCSRHGCSTCCREYWRAERPGTWLFPGPAPEQADDPAPVGVRLRSAGRAGRPGQARHTPPPAPYLRHPPAGGRHRTSAPSRPLLGHRSLRTTALYTYVSEQKSSPRRARWTCLRQCPSTASASASPASAPAPDLLSRPTREGRRHDCPALEVADVLRAYGPAYLEAFEDRLSPEQRRVLRDLAALPNGRTGRPCRGVRPLRPPAHRLQLLPQPSLPQVPGGHSCRLARRAAADLLPWNTSTSSLPSRTTSARWPCRTRAPSTARCSGPAPRRCYRSRQTRSTSEPRSASCPCCIPGGRTSICTRTSIASCRGADCPPTGAAGCLPARLLPAGEGSQPRVPRQVPVRCWRKHSGGVDCRSTAGRSSWRRRQAFFRWTRCLRDKEWVVYAKPPFGGPEQVLKYLARYTHRVAISNSRLVEGGGRPGPLHLEGLRGRQRREDDGVAGVGVHPAVPSARVAVGVRARTGTTGCWRTAAVRPSCNSAGSYWPSCRPHLSWLRRRHQHQPRWNCPRSCRRGSAARPVVEDE